MVTLREKLRRRRKDEASTSSAKTPQSWCHSQCSELSDESSARWCRVVCGTPSPKTSTTSTALPRTDTTTAAITNATNGTTTTATTATTTATTATTNATTATTTATTTAPDCQSDNKPHQCPQTFTVYLANGTDCSCSGGFWGFLGSVFGSLFGGAVAAGTCVATAGANGIAAAVGGAAGGAIGAGAIGSAISRGVGTDSIGCGTKNVGSGPDTPANPDMNDADTQFDESDFDDDITEPESDEDVDTDDGDQAKKSTPAEVNDPTKSSLHPKSTPLDRSSTLQLDTTTSPSQSEKDQTKTTTRSRLTKSRRSTLRATTSTTRYETQTTAATPTTEIATSAATTTTAITQHNETQAKNDDICNLPGQQPKRRRRALSDSEDIDSEPAAKRAKCDECFMRHVEYDIVGIDKRCGQGSDEGTLTQLSEILEREIWYPQHAAGVENFVDLLLSRAGIFNWKAKNLTDTFICAKHLKVLGDDFVLRLPKKQQGGVRELACAFPKEITPENSIAYHEPKSRSASKTRFLSKSESVAIAALKGVRIPTGTRMFYS